MKCYYNQVVKRLAGVAELADALDSGSSGSNLVEVQVLSPAFFCAYLTFRLSPRGLFSIRKKPRAMRVEEKIALALGIKIPPDIIESSPPA